MARGEVFGLLGPNGAGKTTTVEILEGFRQPDAGTVRVLGFDPAAHAPELRARTGVVLQECGFPLHLRVGELIDAWRSFYPSTAPARRAARRSSSSPPSATRSFAGCPAASGAASTSRSPSPATRS